MPEYEWKCDNCKARGRAQVRDEIKYKAQLHLAKRMSHTVTAWRRGKIITGKNKTGRGTWRIERLDPWQITVSGLGPIASLTHEEFWARVDDTLANRKEELRDAMRRTRHSRRR